MKNFFQKFSFLFFFLFISFVFSSCGEKSKIIQLKGSDTMVNMAQALVEAFSKKYPKIYVAVTGGGSGTGVASLISGTCDIAMCSRDMNQEEIEIAQKRNVNPYPIHIATDAIAIIVSPKNPVSKLTIDELSDIFSGKKVFWKELGPYSGKIVALSRDRNSGTHVFFLEHVVKKGDKKSKEEFGKNVLMMPSTQAIVEEVSSNPDAIGYIGLGYLNKKVKVLAISNGKNFPYIIPSVETAIRKVYPISRTMFFYTNGAPSGDVGKFIDFAKSEEGRKIVLGSGFVPIKN